MIHNKPASGEKRELVRAEWLSTVHMLCRVSEMFIELECTSMMAKQLNCCMVEGRGENHAYTGGDQDIVQRLF